MSTLNYADLSDEELNRAVAERLEPEPWVNDQVMDSAAVTRTKSGLWRLVTTTQTVADSLDYWLNERDFANDPEAWGWLLEKERLALEPAALRDSGREVWLSGVDGGTDVDISADKPGRAICIAYLEATAA